MKQIISAILLLAVITTSQVIYGQTKSDTLLSIEERVDKLFTEWDDINSPGVEVLVVKDNKVIYDKGFGSAHLDYNIPITSSTVFHIGSVSKQFTAFAIATLAQQGKLSLDDDIHKYIPELQDYGKTITIRQCLHHTNGLRDVLSLLYMSGWQYEDVLNNEQALNILYKQKELVFDPGEKFSYNNSGYVLLAEVVERVSGQSFAEWMKQNVFEPLSMTDSFVFDDHNVVIKNRAHSYFLDDNSYKPYNVNFTLYGPACVYSTALDLKKWADNFDNPVAGNKQLFEQMEERGILNDGDTTVYAFGQAVMSYKGIKCVFHSGAQAGFKSALMRFPDHKLSIIVFANCRNIDETEFANKIADIYLADYIDENAGDEIPGHHPREEFEPLSLTQDQLQEYVGEYYSEEVDSKCAFAVENGKLIVKHKRYSDSECTPKAKDVFDIYVQWLYEVEFVRDDTGQIVGLNASTGRVSDIKFVKL